MTAGSPVRCRAEGCGRVLRDPLSVSVGVGPVCRARLGIRVTSGRRATVVVIPAGGPVRGRRVEAAPDQLALDLDAAS